MVYFILKLGLQIYGLEWINTRRTDGVIFDPWDTLTAHIFGTACNKILKFQDFS